ncbi:Rid family detoxifying hydrolase [Candidatus Woesearchaeota archaeon]|nr:Rid family detoxifying hydrolase [Candidatus Woesearchaeota archaeon]
MPKTTIPAGNFPFSNAVIHSSKYMMEISGQIGLNPDTGKLVDGIENQTRQTLENIKTIIEQAHWSLSDIVKVRIYLTDIKYYAKVNEIYKEYFSKEYPARVALAVKELPLGALIEIECTAAKE